jgi:ankyrin repeat protein
MNDEEREKYERKKNPLCIMSEELGYSRKKIQKTQDMDTKSYPCFNNVVASFTKPKNRMMMTVIVRSDIRHACIVRDVGLLRKAIIQLVNTCIPKLRREEILVSLPVVPESDLSGTPPASPPPLTTIMTTTTTHGLNYTSERREPYQRDEHRHILYDNQWINICDMDGLTVLHYACMYGDVATVSYVINCGANPFAPDKEGVTPLIYAVMHNNVECQLFLLARYQSTVHYMDHKGRTALYYATNRDTVRVLARNGARVNDIDLSGKTPFLMAAHHWYYDAMNELALQNADTTVVDNMHRTALHLGVGCYEIVDELLETYGLHVDAVDSNGQTPLHIALLGHYSDVVGLLRSKYGARVDIRDNMGRTAMDISRISSNQNVREAMEME